MVTHYTLHKIVITYFIYQISSFSQFELVLISLNQLQPNCSSDWFELIWTGFLWFSPVFFSSYLIRQPVAVAVASQEGKKLDLTGL